MATIAHCLKHLPKIRNRLVLRFSFDGSRRERGTLTALKSLPIMPLILRRGPTIRNRNAQTSKTGGETSAANDLSDAAGGNDIEVSERKVFYAPAGATFAPLAINRLPNNPLQNGKITSCFGYRENPLNGEESFHQGLDIAADMNSPVAAMFSGL